jgi:hypothetical protein
MLEDEVLQGLHVTDGLVKSDGLLEAAPDAVLVIVHRELLHR